MSSVVISISIRLSQTMIVLLAVCCAHVQAEDAPAPGILLRNVYVPANKTSTWPTDGASYLPIEAERLEQLLSVASTPQTDTNQLQAVQLVLYGKLTDGGQVVGRGAMQVAPRTSTQRWLALPAGSFELRDPMWREQQTAARWGYWPDAQGAAIETPREGWLDFEWIAAPTDSTDFRLKLPSALATALVLDLPKDLSPELAPNSDALIEPPQAWAPGSFVHDAFPDSLPEIEAGHTRWALRCGPGEQLQWQLNASDSEVDEQKAASYHEHIKYRVRQSGVTERHAFGISAVGMLPSRVKLSTSGVIDLRLAEFNGQPVAFHPLASESGYEVVLPKSSSKTGERQLVVEAWRPPLSDTASPLSQIVLSDLYWSSGVIDLQLENSLQVADLRLRSAVWERLTDRNPPGSMSFEKTLSRGRIELAVTPRVATNSLLVSRALKFGSTGTRAVVATQWRSTSPDSVRVLTATLTDDWTPESVVVAAPYEVNDWYVATDKGSRQLVIRVSRTDPAMSPTGTPLQLRVEAIRTKPASTGWSSLTEYAVLSWQDANTTKEFWAVDVEDGYQLEINPPPVRLPESEAATVRSNLPSLSSKAGLYDWALQARNPKVFLKPAIAEIDAIVETAVVDRIDRWDILHRIRCTPKAGSVAEIRLQGVPDRGEKWRWKLEGDQRWQTVQQSADGGANALSGQRSDPSTVTLALVQRLAKPFVILLEKRTVSAPVCTPANIEVVGAESSAQWTFIRTPNPRYLVVEADGWRLSNVTPPDNLPVHSAWLANPAAKQRLLSVMRSSEAGLPLASIVEGKIVSTYMPRTASKHRLTLTVHNQAEKSFTCELPSEAENVYWQTDGKPGQTRSLATGGAGNRLTLPLASPEASETFIVEFTLPSQQLEHGSVATAPWPKFSIPAIDGVWEVRAPSEYYTLLSTAPQNASTWRARLFGPLSGDSGANWPQFGERSTATLTTITAPIAGDAPPRLWFGSRPTSYAYRCLMLMLAALLGYWLWRKPIPFLLALAIAAIAALLLPAGWYGWATAAWGGLLLGLAMRVLTSVSRVAHLAWRGRTRRLLAVSSASILLLLVLDFHPALAQPDENPQHVAPIVEKVLIPVDGEGRLSGDQRYITPELMAELLRRERALANRGAWVVSSPKYSGSIVVGQESKKATGTRQLWECRFDLEVLRAPSVVSLPFHQEDAEWTGEVLLDGAPTAQVWGENGNSMQFAVERTGQYQVRVEFQPKVVQQEAGWKVDLRVPPLPDGQLRLGAAGLAERPTVNGRLAPPPNGMAETIAMSTPTDSRLCIEWPYDAATTPLADKLAEQHEWLSVTPSEVAIDAVYRLVGSGELGPLELLVNQQPAVLRGNAANTRMDWRLEAPLSTTTDPNDDRLVQFRLVTSRSASLGRIRIPELELAGIATATRQMAASSSEELEVTLSGAASLDQAAAEQLLQYWPDRESPAQAVDLDRATGTPTAAVRRQPEEVFVDESLEVCCMDDCLHIRYEGEFAASRGPQYMKTISVSPDLKVDAVKLVADNTIADATYSRASGDRLLVLFPEPRSGPYRLKILGHAPLERDAAGNAAAGQIPRITASDDSTSTQGISLYASDHLLAELVQGEVEPQLTETMNEPQFPWQAYGVGAFLTTPDRTTPLVVLVSENLQHYTASLLTTMIRRDNAWIAEIDILLNVTQGKLLQAVLHWPDSMVGEVEVATSSGMDMQVNETTPRQLQLRFGQAVAAGAPLRITLRSAVRPDGPGRVTCPIVDILGADDIQRYFGQLEDEAGAWTWQRVKSSVAPASIEGLLAAWPSAKLLKATGDRPAGEWTATATDKRTYRLPLASISTSIGSPDGRLLQTRLVVPAWSIDSYALIIPSNQKLIRATVDDDAAIVSRRPLGQMRLQMPDPNLPHLVTLVTQIDPAHQDTSIDTPTLYVGAIACEIEHHVYSIEYPAEKWTLRRSNGDNLPSVDVAALRLNQLLAGSTSSLSISATPVAESWARSWINQFERAESQLREAIAAAPPQASDVISDDEASEEYDNLLARTVAEKIRIRAAADLQSTASENVSNQAFIAGKQDAMATQIFVQSTAGPLRLVIDSAEESDSAVRWALAIGIALLASLRIAARNEFSLPLAGYEMLFPAVIVAGLFWWLFLWPRTAGLLLALAAIVAWLRWNRIRPQLEAQPAALSAE